MVNQREVGADTESFPRALKSVVRQDPDVILVGEMRDLETMQTALTAAETGHLVFATLHTQDGRRPSTASSTCSRRTSRTSPGADLLDPAGRPRSSCCPPRTGGAASWRARCSFPRRRSAT